MKNFIFCAVFGPFCFSLIASLRWTLKNYLHIWKERSQISQIPPFREKVKKIQTLNQKCSIWMFLDYNFQKLMSYLKATPSNFSKYNVSFKTKQLKIWYQQCLIWVFFGLNSKKNLFSYLKAVPSNLPKWIY